MTTQVVFLDIGDTLVSKTLWPPGAKEFLAEIGSWKIRTGLISNTSDLTRDQLLKLLPNDFDFSLFEDGLVMLSSEIGIEKPGLAIFFLATHHAGVSPWETLFIGENLNEMLVAQKAGMLTARICDAKSDFEALAKLLKR